MEPLRSLKPQSPDSDRHTKREREREREKERERDRERRRKKACLNSFLTPQDNFGVRLLI